MIKKKMYSLLVLLMLSGLLAGCGNSDSSSNSVPEQTDNTSAEKLKVVTTIFPQYDIVRELAGDNVELTMLLAPGAESHSYDPSPQDIITIQNCDIFIYVGGESDDWVDQILNSMDTSNMEIISLMDLVDVVEEELVEGMESDHNHSHDDDHDHEEEDDDHEHEEAEYDEHVWTSPKNAQIMVRSIMETLCELDPENSDGYQTNAESYIVLLEELDEAFREMVAGAVRKTIMVGDRFPFRYLADEYGLNYYAAFSGCSNSTDASAGTLAFLIDKTVEEEIPVVFHIELSNERITDTICEGSGAEKLLLHSCHNVTKDDFTNGVGYLDLMWQNIESLRAALY